MLKLKTCSKFGSSSCRDSDANARVRKAVYVIVSGKSRVLVVIFVLGLAWRGFIRLDDTYVFRRKFDSRHRACGVLPRKTRASNLTRELRVRPKLTETYPFGNFGWIWS